MSLLSLFVTAVGLAMDAFAVSVCKGLALKKVTFKNACLVGLWFGAFQALMPLLGFLLGVQFERLVKAVDHWIAFALLSLIGLSMLREAFSKKQEKADDSLSPKTMSMLALATSIDALAVGITYAFLQVSILPAVSLIGIVAFVLSAVGVKVGSVFGTKYKAKAEAAGGIILLFMGAKILLEHLHLLPALPF